MPFFKQSKKSEKEGPTSLKDDKTKKETEPKEPKVSTFQLFRFATTKEKFLICVALIGSIGTGVLTPFSILIYGQYVNNLSGNLNNPADLLDLTAPVIRTMACMASGVIVAAYISNALWIATGESQTRRIRSLYVHSVLRQDMSWFDKAEEGSLTTRLATDTQLIQDGISEKFGLFVMLFAQFIGGFVVAFIKGWRLAVVMLAAVPLLSGIGAVMDYFITKYTLKSQDSYAAAGAIAEQVFNSVRTVYSFNLQKRFAKRYCEALTQSLKSGMQRGSIIGSAFASFMFLLFGVYALALWYGSQLVTESKLDGATVLVVVLSMMMGCMALLELPYNLSAVSSATGAAYKIYAIIDRTPEIDIDSKSSVIPESIKGAIEFKNVMFKYPTRPDLVILKDLSLKIKPGMTAAFVGPSGSGKSTTIQLVQRLYDPLSGQVLIDGQDLKTLNLKWVRQNIGIVGQEPVLFNMTIRQNVLMGSDKEVSEEDMINACKEANCHSFITQLPKGYDTLVGEHGGMISGGQKQRIAIARAILKNPIILLLDEATSALDTQSERLVQSALDKASANRTTIVVAHRLSTIVNADLIVVLDHGEVVESGTHNDLLQLNGVYADLVRKQEIDTKKKDGEFGVDDKNVDPELLLKQEQLEIEHQTLLQDKQAAIERILSRDSVIKISEDEKADAYQKSFSGSSETINAYDLKILQEKQRKELMKSQKAPVREVIMQMKPEWKLLAFGVFGAGLGGCIFPLFSFIFARVITIISVPGEALATTGPLKGANLYAFLFVILGIGAFVGWGLQVLCFEIAGEKYTNRLRAMIFSAYMRQEIGYFDREENNAGALTAKLAVDARNVNQMITKVWGDLTRLCSTIIVGFVIAFTQTWELTLIILCMAPFILFASSYEMKVHRGYEDKTKEANAESGKVAGEAIREIRTVAALNRQDYFEDQYKHSTERPHKLAVKRAYLSSIGYALTRGISLYTNCVAFYGGVRLIMNGTITFQQMFTSMSVIMTTCESAGRSSVFASTFAKAKYSALSSFEVLERAPQIDSEMEGLEPKLGSIKGDIEFDNITFAYPARKENNIFNGDFYLKGAAGQNIGLVGASGCGKSTVIGMLQRWYDPLGGTVSLDQKDVKGYTVNNLRSHIALVGQEPVLFDMTIGENVRFGVDDDVEVTQEDVETACKAANIHNFIASLPKGYDTRVGDKGSQLSGGQKQRIAIARALIRKPRVLLLDEATSALDRDSEKLVQEALDNILEEGGRTTITIAHRLSTIQNADMICVVKDGRVIEQGTHHELFALNGFYSELVQEQSLSML